MLREKSLVLLVLCLALFSSCDRQRIGYMKHVVKYKKDSYVVRKSCGERETPMTLKNGLILLPVEMNGQADTVQVDFGVNAPMIRFVAKDSAPDIPFFDVPIQTVERTKLRMSAEPLDLSFGLCAFRAYCNVAIIEDIPFCEHELSVAAYPLLGSYGFLEQGKVSLDFTNSKLGVWWFEDTLDLTGYQEVRCRFTLLTDVIKIYLTIDGKERECLFDTGNQGGIILKDKRHANNPKDGEIPYEGSYGRSASGPAESQHYCISPDETIQIGDFVGNGMVQYVENISMDNLGIQFIQQFDWIINPYKSKVYFKPRDFKPAPLSVPPYSISTTGGQITILNRRMDMNPAFEVGDVIVSIDGEAVTAENICHFYDLLRNADSWSEFDIKVQHGSR